MSGFNDLKQISTEKSVANTPHYRAPGLAGVGGIELAGKRTDAGVADIDKNKQKADKNQHEIYDEGKSVPKEELDPYVNNNYAKDGGQFGTFLGQGFYDTLKRSRLADAYNNRPEDHIMAISGHKGVHDLGTGYDKPKIETEDMREIRKDSELDEKQKNLGQMLQAAVNNKDLDMLKEYMKERYGIEPTRFQAENLLRQIFRQHEITTLISRDQSMFSAMWSRYFGERTVQFLWQLNQENPLYAKALAGQFGVTPPPELKDALIQDLTSKYAKDIAAKNGRTSYNFNDMAFAELAAERDINKVLMQSSAMTLSTTNVGSLIDAFKANQALPKE